MAILKREMKRREGKSVELELLQCDLMPARTFWVTPASRRKLEADFDGKHYCNDAVKQMQESGDSRLPVSRKSSFVKR